MAKDGRLQRDVMAELEFEPSIDHTQIGVAVTEGVVTLTGYVKSYPEKLAAEKAARRVHGVRAIAEEIIVRPALSPIVVDAEVANRILRIFAWDAAIPDDIKVKVEHGEVTLSGRVKWRFQSQAAAKAAGRIYGVTRVINLIEIKEAASASDVRQQIVDAFKRSADIDAATITVTTDGGKVTLGGRVHAWRERQTAERAAWAAPGVTKVEDQIELIV